MADVVKRRNSSRGEMKVEDILDFLNIPYEVEYVYNNLLASSGKPLRFDFAVFDDEGDVAALIEIQGQQHYEQVNKFGGKRALQRQKFNDAKKRSFCSWNKINLIEIPYWEIDELSAESLMEKIDL